MPEATGSPTSVYTGFGFGPPSDATFGRSCRQCSVRVSEADGHHAAARRRHGAVGRLRLRTEPKGVDAVGEDRLAVGRAAGLQAADEARQGEHPRVRLRRQRIRRRPGVDRRVVQDLAVLGSQDVEAAVLAAHPDHLGRLALDRNRVDLGRVADRLVLVPPRLRVVGAHGVGPDVAGVDLRDPRSLPSRTSRAMTAHDSRVYSRGSSAVGRRGAVLTSVPKIDRARLRVERRRAPDGARRRAEVEHVLAPVVLDRDRRVEGLGLGADVVLPDDLARLRLQGHDEAPAGAALVAGERRRRPARACRRRRSPCRRRGSARRRSMFSGWAPGNSLSRVLSFQRSFPVARSSA